MQDSNVENTTEIKEEEKTKPVEVIVHPAEDRSQVVAFIKDLKNNLQKSDIEKYIWLTKKGLFVQDEFLVNITQSFIKWFQANTTIGQVISTEKSIYKLFQEETPQTFYLPQGRGVTVGRLVPVPDKNIQELRGSGVRIYEGFPLDTKTNLHPKDPIFDPEKGVTSKVAEKGLSVVIERKNKEPIILPYTFLQEFSKWLTRTGELKREFPSRCIRDIVVKFISIARRLRVLPKKYGLLIPGKYRKNDNSVQFVLYRGCVFIFEKNTAVSVFALRGKGFREFVKEEVKESVLPAKNLGKARISRVKEGFIGTVDLQSLIHKFGLGLVFSFIQEVWGFAKVNRGKLPGKLPIRFTVRDVIIELSYALDAAAPEMKERVAGRAKDQAEKDDQFLVALGEWFFLVEKGKFVKSVVYQKKVERKPVSIVIKDTNETTSATAS